MSSINPVPLLSPEVSWKHERLPPGPLGYITKDDYLQATVFTTTPTTGLRLAYRFLDSAGAVHYSSESLDGAAVSTLTTKIFALTEGFLLSVTASNLGGGLADQICFVMLGLQQSRQTGLPPHTVLAQGYVSNLFTVDWPPVYVRGPAPTGGAGVTPIVSWLTTTQTYTTPGGARALFVEAVGGGGGGGGVNTTAANFSVAGGGGSGGYSASYIASPLASYLVTIGGGGAGGTAGGAGAAGTATTFGAVITANGGGGAAAGTPAGTAAAFSASGAGATIGTGDIALPGSAGAYGVTATATLAASGGGAPGPFTTTGGTIPQLWRIGGVGFAGVTGGLPGGGGSGALNMGTQATTNPGGAGGAGIVRVWQF
jgi:hypothetical protein